jgi:hypothetical protein
LNSYHEKKRENKGSVWRTRKRERVKGGAAEGKKKVQG